MGVISWIVLGLIAGLIANILDPRPARGGALGAIVLGILGALVGGFMANLIFGFSITGFDFQSLIIAVLGAMFLLLVGRLFRRA